jgi:Family of unknown function (DUF5681)
MNRDDDNRYTVGRNKPPKEHQFAKGRSGNPNGRPKKALDGGGDFGNLPLHELVLAEASRTLTLREDGRPAKRTVSETVLMKTWMLAASGNVHAQRTFLQMLQTAQARDGTTRTERLRFAYELKLDLQEARDKYVAAGRDELTMQVHPSDVEIDCVTGDVRFFTPITDEDWAGRELLLRLLDEAHVVLARVVATLQEEKDDPFLQLGREVAIFKAHIANEGLPPRFRRPPPEQFRVRAGPASRFLERLAPWPSFHARVRAKLGDLDPD